MNDTEISLNGSAEANRLLVDSFTTRFLAGDVAGAAELCDEDIVLHVGGDHELAGDHRGLGGVLQWIARSTEILGGGSEHFEVLDVLGGQDHGAAYLRVMGDRPGRVSLDNHTVHLHRIVGGRIVEVWFHNRDQSVVDTFWR